MNFIVTNKKKIFICFILSIITILIFPTIVFANSETINIIETYKQADILKNADFFAYIFRKLGWWCSLGLYYLVLGIENIVLSINKEIGGFFEAPEFVNFLNKFKPLMFGLLAISLSAIGLKFMLKPKTDKSKIATNIIVSMLVIVGLPAAMSELHKLTNAAIETINLGNLSIADEVLYENITDVCLYDNMGMPVPIPKLDKSIYISKDKLKNINPTQTIDYKDMKMRDVFKNTTKYDSNGQAELKKNKSEKFGLEFTTTMYYRYNINFFTIMVTLIISGLALTLCGIKITRLLYELAINQSIAMFSAVTDIGSGQRLKKSVEMILGTFVILFSCFFLLQLYVIGSAYCNAQIDNILARLIVLGSLAWAVIDGPNLIERIVGIDAGINSAFKAITGTYMAGKAIGSISKGIKGFTSNVSSKVMHAGATGAGIVNGVVDAAKETRYKENSNNSSPVTSTSLTTVPNSENLAVSKAVSQKSNNTASPFNSTNTSKSTRSNASSMNTSSALHNSDKNYSNNTNRKEKVYSDKQNYNSTSTQSSLNSNQSNISNQNINSNNDYEGRTWKSEKKAQIKQSNTANTYRRAYNLTKNGIVESYDNNKQKKQQKLFEKNQPNSKHNNS